MRRTSFVLGLAAAWTAALISAAAEMRTWTAASGGFTIEAEFVELKGGDLVRLKTKDGREIEVPLSQLSAADQALVKPAAPAGPVEMPKSPSAQLTRTLRAADRCRMPDAAIVIFKVFHDDPQTSPAEKAYAAGRLAELTDLAARKMVRVNKTWVSQEDADAVRKKADELMRQGLQLMKLKQEDSFRRKFSEASALEPEDIRADFLAALVYTMGRAADKALPIFQKCLSRDPENIAVLNNVALLAAAKRDYNTALTSWRRAIDLQPDQRVVHNVGRFLEQCTETNLKVPKNIRDALSLPYVELTSSGKFEPTSPKIGWLLMLIETSDLDISMEDDKKEEKQESPAPPDNDDGAVIGSGTGFVVHPGYIMTNAHVAMNDAAFEIQTPDGKLHKAVRVASDEQDDLALLKCEEIDAPPLLLQTSIVSRGTDVMLFGYPEMLVLGTSLKATRGSISSLPDPKINSKYLYDAVSNAGNSGGPLCDDRANVVAVHSTGYNTASRYAGGIPSTTAIEFVKASIPEYQPPDPSTAKLEWPQVDDRASKSTMLIWIRSKQAKPEAASVGGELVELPFCLFCGGLGKFKCVHPGCVGGRVTLRQGRVPCPTCEGKAVLDCEVCLGVGIDLQLASVQRALAKIAAAKAAAGTSSTGTTSTGMTSTRTAPGTGGSTTPSPTGSTSSQPVVATKYQGKAVVGDMNSAGTGVFEGMGVDPGVRVNPNVRLDQYQLRQLWTDLGSDPGRIKAAAKQLYSTVPDPGMVGNIVVRLNEAMRHPDWSVRRDCVRALETWNNRPISTELAKAADDDSWVVRDVACYVIVHIGDPENIRPLLMRLEADPKSPTERSGQVNRGRERALAVRCLIAMGPKVKQQVEQFRQATNYFGKCAAEEILNAYASAQ